VPFMIIWMNYEVREVWLVNEDYLLTCKRPLILLEYPLLSSSNAINHSYIFTFKCCLEYTIIYWIYHKPFSYQFHNFTFCIFVFKFIFRVLIEKDAYQCTFFQLCEFNHFSNKQLLPYKRIHQDEPPGDYIFCIDMNIWMKIL